MTQSKPGFPDEQRSSNDNRKRQTNKAPEKIAPPAPKRETFGQRWNAMEFSKTSICWICLAMIAGTMLVGFTWGGWVTDRTAQKTATAMTNDAVIQRLSSICVAQSQQDPAKDEKLTELKAASRYEQQKLVKEHGWSTMPGDEASDTKVANACAKLLVELNE